MNAKPGVLLLAAGLASCGLPLPYSVSNLREDAASRPTRALPHYLSQPDADVAVCDPASPEYAFAAHPPEVAVLDALVAAVRDGTVRPDTFRGCATSLLPEFAQSRDEAVHTLVEGFADRAADVRIGSDAIAEALHDVLIARPQGALVSGVDEASLRALAANGDVSMQVRSLTLDLVETAELDRGTLDGRPVDARTLATTTDRARLSRMRLRLPSAALRAQATRRLVTLVVDASGDPDVLADRDGVIERVSRTGMNAIDLGAHPITATVADGRSEFAVVARENVRAQSVRFWARQQDAQTVLPTLDLVKLVTFHAQGLAHAIRLCGSPESLAITPCIEAKRLSIRSPAARLDDHGVVHFADALALPSVPAMLHPSGRIPLPILEGERALLDLAPELHFDSGPPLVFEDGLALDVELEERAPYLVARVSAKGASYTAIFDSASVPPSSIVSRGSAGTRGHAGTTGMSGSRGMSGFSAMCPSSNGGRGGPGGSGGPGGRGGDGGDGQDGGDISIVLSCAAGACDHLSAVATSLLASEGGPGGPGGPGGQGGRGGDGGSGGSGQSCNRQETTYRYNMTSGRNEPSTRTVTTNLSSGWDGPRGSDGMHGMNGNAGAPGRPGKLRIVTRAAVAGAR